jgi:hypothetical protein
VFLKYRREHATTDWRVSAHDLDALAAKIAIEYLMPTVQEYLLAHPAHNRRAPEASPTRLARRELVSLVDDSGSKFFSAGAKRFFNSKLESEGLVAPDGSVYFVTSEQQERDGSRGGRRFSIRRFDGKQSVKTVGAFMGYGHREDALDELRGMLPKKAARRSAR